MPSEAQWEYACRGLTNTPFYFGETITTDLGNYNGNYTYNFAPKGQYRQQTTDVGIFPANVFGLYDMHGNVWEWCQDSWQKNYKQAPRDGSVWISNENDNNNRRILRGGSWVSHPRVCRCASRFMYERGKRDLSIGFRVVVVALNSQQSTVNSQQSTVNSQQSTVNSQQSTVINE
ncbi:MAG: formylglycine-generating enzyme family protein [Cyanobacteria bacterium J06635_10]